MPGRHESCFILNIMTQQVDADIIDYVTRNILPRYEQFDKAHRTDHVTMVIERSLTLAEKLPGLNPNMVYCIAAYHDLGLVNGRERHHIDSGAILAGDSFIRSHFSNDDIETMRQAIEDHRASGKTSPRSPYGMIVADADRFIDPETIIRRTVQYGLANYPELDRRGHYDRTLQHLNEKYGPHGYLKVWLPWSDNAERLHRLHEIIADPSALSQTFNRIFDTETSH